VHICSIPDEEWRNMLVSGEKQRCPVKVVNGVHIFTRCNEEAEGFELEVFLCRYDEVWIVLMPAVLF
jgi:hypothetical protein